MWLIPSNHKMGERYAALFYFSSWGSFWAFKEVFYADEIEYVDWHKLGKGPDPWFPSSYQEESSKTLQATFLVGLSVPASFHSPVQILILAKLDNSHFIGIWETPSEGLIVRISFLLPSSQPRCWLYSKICPGYSFWRSVCPSRVVHWPLTGDCFFLLGEAMGFLSIVCLEALSGLVEAVVATG